MLLCCTTTVCAREVYRLYIVLEERKLLGAEQHCHNRMAALVCVGLANVVRSWTISAATRSMRGGDFHFTSLSESSLSIISVCTNSSGRMSKRAKPPSLTVGFHGRNKA